MKRPYVFYFPCHSRSNGIRVMMLLSRKLMQQGFEVLYYVKGRSDWPKDVPILDKIDARLRKVAIAVYPEIVAGNPLRIRNVARLVLFYPGRNGGMRHYHKSEMTFAYFPEFLPGADVLTIPWIDENLHPYTGEWLARGILKGWGWPLQKGGYERERTIIILCSAI